MMDRKAIDYYFGVGRALCNLCSLSKEKCHNINIVSEGISLTKLVKGELLQLGTTVKNLFI